LCFWDKQSLLCHNQRQKLYLAQGTTRGKRR
jgi:hypothetical protein